MADDLFDILERIIPENVDKSDIQNVRKQISSDLNNTL